jgi:hypothetical protein
MKIIKEAPITIGSGKDLIKQSPFLMEGRTALELALRNNYEAQKELRDIIDEGVEGVKKERDEEWIIKIKQLPKMSKKFIIETNYSVHNDDICFVEQEDIDNLITLHK